MRTRPSGRPCANGFNNRLAGNSNLRDAFSDPFGNSRQCKMDDLGGSAPFSAFGWCLRDTTRPPPCALRACLHCIISPGASTGACPPPRREFDLARARMACARVVRVCFHRVGAISRPARMSASPNRTSTVEHGLSTQHLLPLRFSSAARYLASLSVA